MRACIVGHGPSLLEKEVGRDIDSHDLVIRQKLSMALLERPQFFGSRTDAVCCSWNLVNNIRQWNAPEYWVFFDSRNYDMSEEAAEVWVNEFDPIPLRHDRELCNLWDSRYREMRSEEWTLNRQAERKETSDDLGHLHMSAGLHTFLYACHWLKPSEITLAGYDNVMSGDFTWSCARGPGWNHYPDHRWDVEKELVHVIANEYRVEVNSL